MTLESNLNNYKKDIVNNNLIENSDDVEFSQNIEDFSASQYSVSTEESTASRNYIEDISDKKYFCGSIISENQKNSYRYISNVKGTHCFDANLSAGGAVIIRISGETANKGG